MVSPHRSRTSRCYSAVTVEGGLVKVADKRGDGVPQMAGTVCSGLAQVSGRVVREQRHGLPCPVQGWSGFVLRRPLERGRDVLYVGGETGDVMRKTKT